VKRILLIATIVAIAGAPARAVQAQVVTDQNARETRDHLRDILSQYPPSLAQVLQLDPSLLTKDDYLTPYPALASYLKQHAEIAHNPTFFLGGFRFASAVANLDGQSPRAQAIREMKDALFFVMVLVGFVSAVGGIVYLVRAFIDHRKWLQAVKIQTDAHTKIVDRMSSNEDLLAYLQSPTGQRLMTLTPALTAPDFRGAAAPVSRILWSLQTGIVMAIGGAGLWIANGRLIEEVAQPLYVVAMLAIAVGIGFIVSAAASFVLSRQLGLIPDSSHA
jgi:hypothetical protein